MRPMHHVVRENPSVSLAEGRPHNTHIGRIELAQRLYPHADPVVRQELRIVVDSDEILGTGTKCSARRRNI